MRFEFDSEKEAANIRKHGVDFSTTPIAFADEHRILLQNQGRSSLEPRFQCIGFDGNGVLTFTFTLRRGIVRVINAGYWRKNRKRYEDQKETD